MESKEHQSFNSRARAAALISDAENQQCDRESAVGVADRPHSGSTTGVKKSSSRRRKMTAQEYREMLNRKIRRMYPWSVLLFFAACASTCFVYGYGQGPGGTFNYTSGIMYSAGVMGILLAHELGHYLQALRYNVPASPPMFIPMPFLPIGTMGAVIVQGGGFANRKALFDIAITGPLAGLVLALPIAWWGIQSSTVAIAPPGVQIFGDPLILQWMYEIRHGALAPGEEVVMTPLLFAGWVGIFITALNLMPIGQLDGGHILYTLIGRKAHWVAFSVVGGAVAWMVVKEDPSFALMIALICMFGLRHPPSADDSAPIGPVRTVLGWLTLCFVFIGFTPFPVSMQELEDPSTSAQQSVIPADSGPSIIPMYDVTAVNSGR